MNNLFWSNKRGGTNLYFLPIGRNKIGHQENKNIFLNTFPGLCIEEWGKKLKICLMRRMQ